jgi:hypothetical protein
MKLLAKYPFSIDPSEATRKAIQEAVATWAELILAPMETLWSMGERAK